MVGVLEAAVLMSDCVGGGGRSDTAFRRPSLALNSEQRVDLNPTWGSRSCSRRDVLVGPGAVGATVTEVLSCRT